MSSGQLALVQEVDTVGLQRPDGIFDLVDADHEHGLLLARVCIGIFDVYARLPTMRAISFSPPGSSRILTPMTSVNDTA